jgi:hypothetical protein
MQVFINEKSLQGQFDTVDVENGIKSFLATLKILDQIKGKGSIFRSNLFFNEEAISGTHFNAMLATNGDLLNGFINNLKSASKWQDSQVHDPNVLYSWNEDIVSDSSVAEVAARKFQSPTLASVLLNFVKSSYSCQTEISILREFAESVKIDCSHSEDSLIILLRKLNFISQRDKYDETLKVPPFDDQTILVSDKFEITVYKNKGRRAYRLKGTNQLWAVDDSEGHLFGKPHIEVFSEIDGKHMGTSIYNEIKLEEKYKRNRKINLARTYPIE